jgi:hypothetical protein
MWCGLTTFIWNMERSIDVHVDSGIDEPGLPPDTITVVAGPHETILHDGHPVRVADLKNRVVLVLADTNVSYQDVVHALDVARGAGARVLGLANKR